MNKKKLYNLKSVNKRAKSAAVGFSVAGGSGGAHMWGRGTVAGGLLLPALSETNEKIKWKKYDSGFDGKQIGWWWEIAARRIAWFFGESIV